MHHLDFYRLSDAGVVAMELQEFIEDDQAVVAVEWGEIVENVLPESTVRIEITKTSEEGRAITVSYPPERAYLCKNIEAEA